MVSRHELCVLPSQRLVLLLMVVSGFACSTAGDDGTATVVQPDSRFFNLTEFVDQQERELIGVTIDKTVRVGKVERTHAVMEVDWQEELAAFEQSNIDRSALWDEYGVDSSETAEGERRYRYTALDSSLYTREVFVSLNEQGQVQQIDIRNEFESFIADTKQFLHWEPGSYQVYSRQAPLWSEPRELEIRAYW